MSQITLKSLLLIAIASLLSRLSVAVTPDSSNDATSLYEQLQNSGAIETSVHLKNVAIHRDRVTITFLEGIIYFSAPVAGKVRAAVFVGSGEFQAIPPVRFEQENVLRLLKSDDVSSNFTSAAFRFKDDTAAELVKEGSLQGGVYPGKAVELARDLAPHLLKETGLNISARQLQSILNREIPGVFLSQFDGGTRGRFTYILDPQMRIPVATFGIDAGEKGLIFSSEDDTRYDIWMAFHSTEEYAKGIAAYSDFYNLVDTKKYTMLLDLREPKKILGLKATLDLVSRFDSVRVLSFSIGEGLSASEDERRKKQLYIVDARLSDGTQLLHFQEPWESGFSVVLPDAVAANQRFSVTLELRGDFMMKVEMREDTYFPRSSETWYPRHGYLPRSVFDISMVHRKRDRVVAIGEMVHEGPAPEGGDAILTEFLMQHPVPLATFAVGGYEIHKDIAKQEGGKELPLEFYSIPGAAKADFILAEMNNSVRFFSKLFGEYPFPVFRTAFHPFAYGQGFPTTIMIPGADSAVNRTFSFLAHETSHQWWGDMVLWRSYRDQWLSEGFAEYSGLLYVQTREETSSQRELIRRDREALKQPPRTFQGIGHGRLVDVGPLTMGHRLQSQKTLGAYSALVYAKGALVLRMLHFLFTDPQTGDGHAFFELMREFVQRYKGDAASTDEFFALANERVGSTPLAQKYGYKNLNWFYRQWVEQTYLPSYEFTYHIEDSQAGTILKGDLYQKGLPENETWFMPLPLVFHFNGGATAISTVAVQGSHTPIMIKLPRVPERVELDPELWILSDRTSISKQ